METAAQQLQQQPSFTLSDFSWKQRDGTRSLHDLASANHEDAELCNWLERAKVGDTFIFGGGASPATRLERVS